MRLFKSLRNTHSEHVHTHTVIKIVISIRNADNILETCNF